MRKLLLALLLLPLLSCNQDLKLDTGCIVGYAEYTPALMIRGVKAHTFTIDVANSDGKWTIGVDSITWDKAVIGNKFQFTH